MSIASTGWHLLAKQDRNQRLTQLSDRLARMTQGLERLTEALEETLRSWPELPNGEGMPDPGLTESEILQGRSAPAGCEPADPGDGGLEA
jgi:hypothetical protein